MMAKAVIDAKGIPPVLDSLKKENESHVRVSVALRFRFCWYCCYLLGLTLITFLTYLP